jgi:hypothetical protein
MNGMSAITWKDILEQHFEKRTEYTKAVITKFLGIYQTFYSDIIGA